MSSVRIGGNIKVSPSNVPVEDVPVEDPAHPQLPFDLNSLRALIHEEMSAAVADVERRLAQARELEQSARDGGHRSVHAEDLNISRHLIDGYTLSANSPSGGSIAWANLHLVFEGVDYTITAGNTALKYTYFVKPASYTPGTNHALVSSDTMPVLGPKDALVFVNNGGTPVSVLESSVSYAVGEGVIGDAQINGTISQSKVTGLQTALSDVLTDLERVEGLAEGAITQHFGPDFPWANGTTQDPAKTGDIYTAQDTTDATNRPNGRSWKWSGANGSPANTWILITDSDVTKALADAAAAKTLAQGKTTTYYRTVAQGVPPTPTDGFATGDEWVQTDNGNYTQRWDGDSWEAAQFGDSAISGIGGAKVGTGINGNNVTQGTVAAARIGAGVNGAVLTTATGQVTPSKINAAFHMLY